jgi:hypothetical protein
LAHWWSGVDSAERCPSTTPTLSGFDLGRLALFVHGGGASWAMYPLFGFVSRFPYGGLSCGGEVCALVQPGLCFFPLMAFWRYLGEAAAYQYSSLGYLLGVSQNFVFVGVFFCLSLLSCIPCVLWFI